MIKIKKISALLTSVIIASTVFVGCGKVDVTPERAATADELIQKFNQYNLANNVGQMAKLYSDVYIQSTGYDLPMVQKILNKNRKGLKVEKSELVKLDNIDDSTKKAVIKIVADSNGEKSDIDYTYAVVKEDNGWAISPDGVLKQVDYPVPQYKKGELNIALSKRIDLFEGGLVKVNVHNDSKKVYSLGTEAIKSQVEIVTDKDTFTVDLDKQVKIEKGLNDYFVAKNDKLTGDVKKVTLKNVYELDKDGNVIDSSKQDIIAYEK